MTFTILVFGFYNKGNLGDQLFIEAFQKLFPEYQFIFTDRFTKYLIQSCDAIFIGGGSFLFAAPNMEEGCLDLLKNKKIFYLGVGAETDIHPIHIELLKIAQLVAIRSMEKIEFLKALNSNVVVIPDLVYSLQTSATINHANNKSVLIVPNMTVVPNWNDAHWKHIAWNYFKCEFAQFLDDLIDGGYSIRFLSMCQNKNINDQYAAVEIINAMKNKHSDYVIETLFQNVEHITSIMAQYKIIITQRFHGIILSEITNTPYIALHHHDKLKQSHYNNGSFLSYYNVSKSQLQQHFSHIINNFISSLPIEPNIFEDLTISVQNILAGKNDKICGN